MRWEGGGEGDRAAMWGTGALGTPGRDQSSARGEAAIRLLLGGGADASHHSWAGRAPSCDRIPSRPGGPWSSGQPLLCARHCCIRSPPCCRGT